MTETTDTPGDPDQALQQQLRERYRELLEELRTILPGVQVLFAFLLTAPFSARFGQLDELGRDLYVVSLVGTALAMVLFLTPAAYHRIAPRQQREQRVRTGVALMVSGLFVLGISVLAAVFTVLRFVFDTEVAVAVVVPLAVLVILAWFVIPWSRRRQFEETHST